MSEQVGAILIRLLCSELKFFYQDGASHLFPEAWYAFHRLFMDVVLHMLL